jgi:hypothetical protein
LNLVFAICWKKTHRDEVAWLQSDYLLRCNLAHDFILLSNVKDLGDVSPGFLRESKKCNKEMAD